MFRIFALTLLATAFIATAQTQTGDCNAPASSPSVTLTLPASPFMVVPSKDGCWVFVSLTGRGETKLPGKPGEAIKVIGFPAHSHSYVRSLVRSSICRLALEISN